MTTNPQDLDAILNRLEKLERRCRAMKRLGIALLLFTGSLLTIGFQSRSTDTIVAKRFMLTDDKGRARGEFTASATDTVLVLSDAKGDSRMTLTVGTYPQSKTNSSITFGDFNHERLRLDYGHMNASITVGDPREEHWSLISWGAGSTQSQLSLRSGEGKLLWSTLPSR